MSSNWPCIECGANEMGHCGKVGCSAMEDQLAEKNIEIARLGRAISDVTSRAELAEKRLGEWEAWARCERKTLPRFPQKEAPK